MIRRGGVNMVLMENLRLLRDDTCALAWFFLFGFREGFSLSLGSLDNWWD